VVDPAAFETSSGPQGVNRRLLCRLLAWELEGTLHRLFGRAGRVEEGYKQKVKSLKVRRD
jgi:hypothetical protein